MIVSRLELPGFEPTLWTDAHDELAEPFFNDKSVRVLLCYVADTPRTPPRDSDAGAAASSRALVMTHGVPASGVPREAREHLCYFICGGDGIVRWLRDLLSHRVLATLMPSSRRFPMGSLMSVCSMEPYMAT